MNFILVHIIKLFQSSIKIVIFFSILILSSCNSPLEVPANRDINLKNNPYSNPLIKVNPTFLNYEFVFTDSNKVMTVQIENNQNVSYPITDYHLFFGNTNFKIINKTFPVILEPKGNEGSKFNIQVQFLGKTPGVYHDTLLFNNITYPTSLLEGKVPYIFAYDVFLNKVYIDEGKNSFVIIKNLSENSVLINKVNITQFKDLFTFTDNFPIEIPRNSSKELHFTFLSSSSGTFSTKLTYDFSTISQKKLIDSTSTVTVICN